MERSAGSKIKLGIFLTTGTLLLIMALYYIGNKQNLFGSNSEIHAVFSHVSGLQRGNNVRYSGINVGTVRDIRIINDTSIAVDMIVSDDILEFIRVDALATIGTDGLMGDQLVNIRPGSPDLPLLSEDDTLATLDRIDSERMLRHLGQTNSNVELISANLLDIVEKVNSGSGTVGKLIYNDGLYSRMEATLGGLDDICERLVTVSIALEGSLTGREGTIGTLLNDEKLAADMKLVVQDLKTASGNLESTTKDLAELMNGLREGKGVAGAVMQDTAMVKDLEVSLENVRLGTAAFNENMEAMRHNWLFRGYFKEQEKAKKNSGRKVNSE